jgi:hypothetical protein
MTRRNETNVTAGELANKALKYSQFMKESAQNEALTIVTIKSVTQMTQSSQVIVD